MIIDSNTMEDKKKQLQDKIDAAKLGGGQRRIDSQHGKGKLTASVLIYFLTKDRLKRLVFL